MRLKSFSVENVRSYGSAEILSAEESISLIIGPNGGGKTNLFDALATVALDKDISDQAALGRFILRQGELEDYLPEGYRAKDLEKLISMTVEEGYWVKLPQKGRDELERILKAVCA